MFKYTIENKNGVYEYSDSFEVNDTFKIRIIILHPVRERNLITEIVKKISIKGENVPFCENYFSAYGFASTVHDLSVKVFINNTNDLKFELIENSKIEVHLLFNENECPLCGYAHPTIKNK